jgi:hypothetical protein
MSPFVHRRVPRIVPLRVVRTPIAEPPSLAEVIPFPRRTPFRWSDPRCDLAIEVEQAFREARHGRT